MTGPISLRLDQIDANESLQPRVDGLDDQHVRVLMDSAESWSPITVINSGGRYLVIDGFHRVEAADRLGLSSIQATILEPASGRSLFDIAFELNAAHGKPLSLRDRRAYAAKLIAEQPELADREIGRRSGLNHETVGDLRRGAPTKYRPSDPKPGELESDISLLDPIRRAKAASRPQKAVAGYIKRLADAVADPYDDQGYTIEGWSDDPLEIARACFLAMGSERATKILSTLENDVRFIAQVARARKDPSLKSLGGNS